MVARAGRSTAVLTAVAVAVALAATAFAQDPPKPAVKIGNPSMFRKLVSAENIENQSAAQYAAMRQQADQQRKLLPDSHPEVVRLRRIANDLLPHATIFNLRARDWKWEINAIDSPTINAFCMPGGKIAFFTGILSKLKLTDDEVAMIMGHEIGHALWEHARERTAKTNITSIGSRVVGYLLLGQAGEIIGAAGSSLAALKFSRNDELEADLIGLELAARAGYDPRAGITLWEKMAGASKGAPPQWLSTHPAGATRIDTIKKNLKDVMPLYEAARSKRAN